MITLIHGDDVVASRNHLFETKKALKGKEQVWVDPMRMPDEEIIQKTQAISLFSADRVIFVENGLSKIDKLVASDVEIVIWVEGQASDSALKKLPKGSKVVQFKPPALIFGFLDSLSPGSKARSLAALEKVLESGVEESLVFYMLLKRVRQLIGSFAPSQNARMAAWQMGRIRQQAQSFGLPRLLKLCQALLRIDWRIKTGRMQKSYIGGIEFLINQI